MSKRELLLLCQQMEELVHDTTAPGILLILRAVRGLVERLPDEGEKEP